MFDTISTVGMSREEWLRIRKTGIGGSDAGAICGLNRYRSAIDVYLDKISEKTEDEDNEAMRIGRDLEGYVAGRFMEATDLKVRRSNRMYRSREHPFMLADVDRLVVGEDAGLEIKTASPFAEDQWKDGSVPLSYLCQVMHYMIILGKRSWYLAVLIMGRGFQYRKIEWDEEFASALIAAEEIFWNNHVTLRKMPTPDGSESCDKILNHLYPASVQQTAIQLTGFDEKLKRREELVHQLKALEQEQRQIDQEIKLFMGGNEAAYNQEYRISWKEVVSSRLDTGRLKVERPEVYQNYLRQNSTRKFTVKAA
ncbi:MAG: YqaJ viral recombinase family protein [Clostridiales bacterium]|nr:YqaJ viral recombinase family protein [Clostridiales bacterium]